MLVVVCLSALLALSLGGEEVKEALSDVKNIAEACNRLSSDWLENYAKSVVTSSGLRGAFPPAEVEVDKLAGRSSIGVSAPGSFWWIKKHVAISVSRGTTQFGGEGEYALLQSSVHLANFRDYWNGLFAAKELNIATSVSDSMLPCPWDPCWEKMQWKQSEAPASLKLEIHTLSCGERVEAILRDNGFPLPCAYEGDISGKPTRGAEMISGVDYKVLIPVTGLRSVAIQPQARLMELLRQGGLTVDWRQGPFEYSFRELNRITKEYQDLPLPQIEKILASERDRAGESLHLIGVRVPMNALRTWGVVLILAIQLYFYLHLVELRKRLSAQSEAWDGAWIALYPGKFAKLMSVVTASFLPVYLAAVLAYGLVSQERRFWLCLIELLQAIIATLLAVLAARTIWNLKRSPGERD